jgi:hypothetical protein
MTVVEKNPPKRRWFQIRIGTILLWMLIVAMGGGWWVDHWRQRQEMRELANSVIIIQYLQQENFDLKAALNEAIERLDAQNK